MTPVLLTNIARPCLYDFMRCNYVNAIVSYFPSKKAEKTKLLIKLVCVSSAVQVSYPQEVCGESRKNHPVVVEAELQSSW